MHGLISVGLFLIFLLPSIGRSEDRLLCSPDLEVQEVIKKYGKEPIVQVIRKSRSFLITIEVNGELRDYMGPPDLQYITPCSIAADMHRLGLTAQGFRDAVQSTQQTLMAPKQEPKPQIVRPSVEEFNTTYFSDRASPASDSQLEHQLATIQAGKLVSHDDPLVRLSSHLLDTLAWKFPNNTRPLLL